MFYIDDEKPSLLFQEKTAPTFMWAGVSSISKMVYGDLRIVCWNKYIEKVIMVIKAKI
jgi:hypothetical protein